ncbi:hypothetical protein CspeluHIS016_0303800 [Cutaneotrichosporon spelunceum]|uniref:Uncharacterized protein n=1 Tax=Cutaneotrichosporon spelunceum TaxID=1672016 RepID=A0AAD3YAZ7_9TREE|nr:hypothetical protein CspeluHIS016_0303800 [Cutaneotrichosporon spelunceum]
MASRTVFDPSTLLRMSPLLAATCTVWANIDHTLFLDFVPTPKYRPTSPLAALFSLYEANTTGLAAVITAALNLIHAAPSSLAPAATGPAGATAKGASAAASLISSWRTGDWSVDWRSPPTLYLAGLALTAAHLALQPYLQRVVRDLVSAPNDYARARAAWRWRRAVFARAVLLDLPAWACFLGAAMGSLRPIM